MESHARNRIDSSCSRILVFGSRPCSACAACAFAAGCWTADPLPHALMTRVNLVKVSRFADFSGSLPTSVVHQACDGGDEGVEVEMSLKQF
jgi:hypothetical protein